MVFYKKISLRCDHRAWEAVVCHQLKTKMETMVALCVSVWAQREGATEVRKGKADSLFTQLEESTFLWGSSSSWKKWHKKNDLSNAMLPHVLTCKKTLAGPLYWTVNKPEDRIKKTFYTTANTDTPLCYQSVHLRNVKKSRTTVLVWLKLDF